MILAHTFGVRYDLPLPLWLFIVASAIAVFGSFLIVKDRAVSPRPEESLFPEDDVAGRRGGAVRSVASLALLAALIVCGLTGSQEVPENILPTTFWLVIWIVVPISCGLVGDWTTPWNPYAVLARLADRKGLRRRLLAGPELTWPRWLGWWPAAALFFFTAGGELIYNQKATEPMWTAIGLLVYAAVTMFCALLFGSDRWLRQGEMFSVLFSTWGRLGFGRFGHRGRAGWLGGLDTPIAALVSRITFVLLMLGSVTFDGLLATPTWKNTLVRLPLRDQPGTGPYIVFALGAFVVLILVLWGFFLGCAEAVRRAGELRSSTRDTLSILLPSMLPIAFAYLIAHNLDYIFVNGQLLIPLLGNPTGHHQWLPAPFNDNYVIDKKILPPALIWYLAVTVIVAAHIVAVVVAHRHLRWAGSNARNAARAEIPWIGAMVLYTMTSLWLLAQPIAKETSHEPSGARRPVPIALSAMSDAAYHQHDQGHEDQHGTNHNHRGYGAARS